MDNEGFCLVNYLLTAEGRFDLISTLLTTLTIIIVIATATYWAIIRNKYKRISYNAIKKMQIDTQRAIQEMQTKVEAEIINTVEEITIQECEKRIPVIVKDYKPYFPDTINDNEADNIAELQENEE